MSRFTPLQLTLLIAFCLYWFLLFPIIWFVIRPSIFVSDIWRALLFAIFLLLVYCIIHVLILFIYERCVMRRSGNSGGRGNVRGGHNHGHNNNNQCNITINQTPLDSVIYEKPTQESNEGATELRFVSSYKLFYDGAHFRDEGPGRNY